MTSGKTISLLLWLLLSGSGWCAEAEVANLIARLAKPAPTTVDFTEVRFSRVLREPLVVSGQLVYGGPHSLDRRVSTPYQEETQIRSQSVQVQRAGQPARSFGLQRAPELRGLLAGLTALLAGDAAQIERDFSIAAQEGEHGWLLELTPNDARIRKRLQMIRARGSAAQARCFELVGAEDSLSVILLGAAAAPPDTPQDTQHDKQQDTQPPTRESLEHRCAGGS